MNPNILCCNSLWKCRTLTADPRVYIHIFLHYIFTYSYVLVYSSVIYLFYCIRIYQPVLQKQTEKLIAIISPTDSFLISLFALSVVKGEGVHYVVLHLIGFPLSILLFVCCSVFVGRSLTSLHSK